MIAWLVSAWATPTLAVADLRNQTGQARFDAAGAGAASMIVTKLAQVDQIRLVERAELDRVLGEIRLSGSGAVDEASAVQAGRVLGADFIVLGTLFAVGDALTVNLRVVDTETAGVVTATEVAGALGADGEGFFTLIDQVAHQILATLEIELTEAERIAVDTVRLREVEALLRYGALASTAPAAAGDALWRDRAHDLQEAPHRSRFVVYTEGGALVPSAGAFARLVGDTETLTRLALDPDGRPWRPRRDPLRGPVGSVYTPEEADRWIAAHNAIVQRAVPQNAPGGPTP